MDGLCGDDSAGVRAEVSVEGGADDAEGAGHGGGAGAGGQELAGGVDLFAGEGCGAAGFGAAGAGGGESGEGAFADEVAFELGEGAEDGDDQSAGR